ncbi:MAG TPA: hydrolase [Candidatus Saccharimonadales bacterium]|nr:hydrolase [Candidatus Saccharimonadales bacterium]
MYAINQLPRQDIKHSPTGCCPEFQPKDWDDKKFHFEDKLFLKVDTRNFMHIPLNMGKVFRRAMAEIEAAGVSPGDEYIILSYDASPWKGEHFISVKDTVPGGVMVRISGHYMAKVFEGPYKDAGKWYKQLVNCVEEKGKKAKKIYFFYTTCPTCAKVYGKNYVVGFAEVV